MTNNPIHFLQGVLAANDPVVAYPLKGSFRTRDASMCNNGEAEMLDRFGNKMSDESGDFVAFRQNGIRTIRIKNNNGNLNVKSLTILIRIRPRETGSTKTIVAFSAQGKLVLLLSLQQDSLRFSLNSSDGERLSASMIIDSKGKVEERKWYSFAITYSHTTGHVTLHSSSGEPYSGFLGFCEVEEPEYVYLGNNIESVMGSSNPEQRSLQPFLGKMECFMVYRRSLSVSEIAQANNLCEKLQNDKGNDDDYDNDNDNDDESGGKLSYGILPFVPSCS